VQAHNHLVEIDLGVFILAAKTSYGSALEPSLRGRNMRRASFRWIKRCRTVNDERNPGSALPLGCTITHSSAETVVGAELEERRNGGAKSEAWVGGRPPRQR